MKGEKKGQKKDNEDLGEMAAMGTTALGLKGGSAGQGESIGGLGWAIA